MAHRFAQVALGELEFRARPAEIREAVHVRGGIRAPDRVHFIEAPAGLREIPLRDQHPTQLMARLRAPELIALRARFFQPWKDATWDIGWRLSRQLPVLLKRTDR